LEILSFSLVVATNAGAQRVAFVTSVTGTGDLNSWGDSGGLHGLAAGDAICVARAGFGGLANAGNFVAWLSNSDDDAYCRLHGLGGTKAGNCGELSLPESAGPWVRTDGMPFAAAVADFAKFDGAVFMPLLFDEFGNEIPFDPSISVLTGTDSDGTLAYDGESCSEWQASAAAQQVMIGRSLQASNGWTNGGGDSCGNLARLACLERVAGPALPNPPIKIRRAFLTSAAGWADLSSWSAADSGTSGLDAGDSICRNLALLAGFGEWPSFKAWLSTDLVDAVDRFTNDGPWVTPNGVAIAMGLADLTDGRLRSAIDVTESGAYLGNYGVWTGTGDDGHARSNRCLEWESADGLDYGATGSSDRTFGGWSQSSDLETCNSTYLHLYCLSDAPGPIFADDFEWGSPGLWGAVVD